MTSAQSSARSLFENSSKPFDGIQAPFSAYLKVGNEANALLQRFDNIKGKGWDKGLRFYTVKLLILLSDVHRWCVRSNLPSDNAVLASARLSSSRLRRSVSNWSLPLPAYFAAWDEALLLSSKCPLAMYEEWHEQHVAPSVLRYNPFRQSAAYDIKQEADIGTMAKSVAMPLFYMAKEFTTAIGADPTHTSPRALATYKRLRKYLPKLPVTYENRELLRLACMYWDQMIYHREQARTMCLLGANEADMRVRNARMLAIRAMRTRNVLEFVLYREAALASTNLTCPFHRLQKPVPRTNTVLTVRLARSEAVSRAAGQDCMGVFYSGEHPIATNTTGLVADYHGVVMTTEEHEEMNQFFGNTLLYSFSVPVLRHFLVNVEQNHSQDLALQATGWHATNFVITAFPTSICGNINTPGMATRKSNSKSKKARVGEDVAVVANASFTSHGNTTHIELAGDGRCVVPESLVHVNISMPHTVIQTSAEFADSEIPPQSEIFVGYNSLLGVEVAEDETLDEPHRNEADRFILDHRFAGKELIPVTIKKAYTSDSARLAAFLANGEQQIKKVDKIAAGQEWSNKEKDYEYEWKLKQQFIEEKRRIVFQPDEDGAAIFTIPPIERMHDNTGKLRQESFARLIPAGSVNETKQLLAFVLAQIQDRSATKPHRHHINRNPTVFTNESVRVDRYSGLGVFADASIAAGTVVLVLAGRMMYSTIEANVRDAKMQLLLMRLRKSRRVHAFISF